MNDAEASRTRKRRVSFKTIVLGSALVLAALAFLVSQDDGIKRFASRWTQMEAETLPSTSIAISPVDRRDMPFSTEGMMLTLGPGEGAEILTSMAAGDAFVFAWISRGGPVSVDLHGVEHDDKSGAFTSYHEAEQAQDGFGHFMAPFDGTHGWYWRNEGQTPVTISVTVSGYFDELFIEDGEHSEAPIPHGPSQIDCCPGLEATLNSST